MHRESLLLRIALLHGALVTVLVAGLALADRPTRGAILGGGAMAVSVALLWAMARAVIVAERRSLVAFLGVLKISLYLALVTAVLTGRLVADGGGFGAGVACFLLATVAVALGGRRTTVTA